MNQYIKICPQLSRESKPNYWYIWFELNDKFHREKAPSLVNSNGYWVWRFQNKFKKNGNNFNWNKS